MIINRWIANYEEPRKNDHIFRKLSWLEWFTRLFRKPFKQTMITYANGITVISEDNPNPSKRRTKVICKNFEIAYESFCKHVGMNP